MKKTLMKYSFIFTFVLVSLLLFSCGEEEKEFVNEGDYSYRLVDGAYEIVSYHGDETNLILPTDLHGKKVVSIGDYAFSDQKSIESVAIGDSFESIGRGAFSDCVSLEKILISDEVHTVGNYAFSGCLKLSSVQMPKNLSKLSEGTFQQCISLSKVSLPDTVAYIGDFAFEGCISLVSFTLPAHTATLGNAFIGCVSLVHVSLSKELREISAETFASCHSLESVSGGANVTFIGRGAFRDCRSLIEFTMPQKLRIVDEDAFSGCVSLKSVKFCEYVNANGEKTAAAVHRSAFKNCESLETVYYLHSGSEERSLLTVDEYGNEAFFGAKMVFTHK